MASRALAEFSISFGLVSIPVKLYSATDEKDGVSFNFIHRGCGSRVKQQYICIREDVPVERSDMDRGFEFAPEKYVIFSPEEIKAVAERGHHTIDIVAFLPAGAVDPIYFDKPYYLGPGKRGEKPYSLLLESMRKSSRVALARWVWRGKGYTVLVRPADQEGLVLQQLRYADEVRPISSIGFSPTEVKPAELDLALMLIEQTGRETFDPKEFRDDVKDRIEKAIEEKIQGKEITLAEEPQASGKVIDLMEALRASLAARAGKTGAPEQAPAAPKARKPVKRVAAPKTPAGKKATGGK